MPLHPQFARVYSNEIGLDERVTLLAFTEQGLLCQETGEEVSLVTQTDDNAVTAPDSLVIGRLNDVVYVTYKQSVCAAISETKAFDLRSLYGRIPLHEWLIAGYAAQVLHWRKTSKFCPVCGHETGPMGAEWVRKCTRCGHERYPQVSPALLILVHDGKDKILMAHKPGWGDRYSIFAGFVLPGESLEECVHREVLEEAGVTVGGLEYSGSQPWPFPHQLMVGFRATYLSGDIEIDRDELDDARWFSADALPALPGELSLSRQMIDAWVTERTERR